MHMLICIMCVYVTAADCIYYSNSIEYLYISKRYAKINNIKNVKSIYNNSLNIENILNIK